MSFAQDVKKEIANLKVDDQYLKSELYGILKLKTEIVIRNKRTKTFFTNSITTSIIGIY